MKREIKFLLQNKETGEIYETEKIDASGDWQHTFQGETKHCQFQKKDYGLLPSTIERRQYTGLKDNNGKEIYEGDIMKVTDPMEEEDNQCVVEWLDNNSCYQYESEQGFGDFDVTSIGWAMQMEFEFEIIGNIYENPELLRT